MHLGDYQPAPTVSTHGIHAYAAEIPAANMDTLAARECKCGNPGETEITYPRVYTRAEICADRGRRFGTDVLGLISLTNREAVGLNTRAETGLVGFDIQQDEINCLCACREDASM